MHEKRVIIIWYFVLFTNFTSLRFYTILVVRLVKMFLVIYEIRRLGNTFTQARFWTIRWSTVSSVLHHILFINIHFNIIILPLHSPKSFHSSGLPNKIQYAYVEIKCQLDATYDIYCRFYCMLNMFRETLCPSSGAREYYTDGRCLWYLVLLFSGCGCDVELKVMCPVCRLLL